jgi:hypothetical protein
MKASFVTVAYTKRGIQAPTAKNDLEATVRGLKRPGSGMSAANVVTQKSRLPSRLRPQGMDSPLQALQCFLSRSDT